MEDLSQKLQTLSTANAKLMLVLNYMKKQGTITQEQNIDLKSKTSLQKPTFFKLQIHPQIPI